MSEFEKTAEYQMGHAREMDAAKWLRDKGYHVIPSYDYNGDGKAPRLEGKSGYFVVPDLDVSKDGNRVWVEVKSKASAVLNFRHGEMVHGIPMRHYNDYLACQRITGADVFLLVHERDTNVYLCAKLKELDAWPCTCMMCEVECPEECSQQYGGMMYFPRKGFCVCE